MFSISDFNIQLKKNSKINLIDFRTSEHYSILCLFESSSSSDTGNLYFIQQNLEDGSFKVKKLIWISDSIISAFSINPTCDWIVIAFRGGIICILPIGTMMSRLQKKSEHWKSNDATYLPKQLKAGTIVTCMKWWTTYKDRNVCIIGRSDGELLIIDLSDGVSLYVEKFPDYIRSIDLLYTKDKTLSYCFITTRSLNQSKLLLEEIHHKDAITDTEFGFEALELTNVHSSSIVHSAPFKKSKGKLQTNPSFLPSKLYQFPQSTFLKSQFCNGKYFLGAYDKMSGKYKLFDCDNLESALYEFQLPMGVVDICVTEELLFLVVENTKEVHGSKSSSIFKESKSLKLCIICRQFAHCRIYEKQRSASITTKNVEYIPMKPLINTQVPTHLSKSLFVEFDLPGLYSSSDILALINFPVFFNFCSLEKVIIEEQNTLLRKTPWLNYIPKVRRNSSNTSLTREEIYSKWSVEEIKSLTPVFIMSSSGISVCYMSQCFEDKFIDHLLSNEIRKADWLGAGLKLDTNALYKYTARLLASGIAHLNNTVKKSKKSLILEYFELASAPMKTILDCISQFWTMEKCLIYALSQLAHINKMSPANRIYLSNAIVPMFGQVMSDPFESIEGVEKKRNKYFDKFRRFVMTNCFFHDLNAAKIMFQFGLVDEAFFIAKEKGCVLDLFSFIMENNYSTKWSECFKDQSIIEKFNSFDRDLVLTSIGLVELEIIARSEPKLIKALAIFICDLFNANSVQTNIFSYQTTNHLCTVFNPYGSIMDTLFRIHASSNAIDFTSFGKRQADISFMFNHNLTSSTESLTDASTFSETLKIRREMGPELLAYCLLVISKDNQILEIKDHIYFVHMYSFISSFDDTNEFSKDDEITTTEQSSEAYKTLVSFITRRKSFKKNKKVLSVFWMKNLKPKLLCLREDLCISISVLDIDLFDDEDVDSSVNKFRPLQNQKKSQLENKTKNSFLTRKKSNQRCQIKMLGFNKDRSNRVLLLPKPIETGKEIIRQISIGKHHVLILTESGVLYAAGSNDCGQLGIENSIIRQSSPNRRSQCLNIVNPMLVQIDLKEDECILSVSAGDYHSGVLVVSTASSIQSSSIFTWGWGVHGQLGHGDIDDRKFPERLMWDFEAGSRLNDLDMEINEFPIELSMGSFHSMVLTNKGKVYCFGNNNYGQLGNPGLQKSLYPIQIQVLPHNITHIDTKYFHSVCSSLSSEIYTWGIHPNVWQSSANQDKSHAVISKPVRIDTDNLLVHEIITQISCGTSHCTILTESKLVYCFGSNVWGQLGIGNRKEMNKLVEVKLMNPVDFISTDDGITVAMNIKENSSRLFVWGRCGHPLIQEHVKNIMTDTIKPQILVEYPHVKENNILFKSCFGIDTIHNGVSRNINKQQLMIIFLDFSKYIDRDRLLGLLEWVKEYDIIADYCLMNESIIQSLFWRIKSLSYRLSGKKEKENLEVIKDDVKIVFRFYIRLTDSEKYQKLKKSVLAMMTGFFKKQNLPWNIYETIVRPLLLTNPFLIACHFVKFSLEKFLTSEFIRDLLLSLTEDNIHDMSVNENLQQINLSSKDIDRFYELIRTGNAETIYDAADDHKVVFFSGCGHASVIGRFREQQLKQMVDKMRKRQLTLSSQMIQRLYNDSSIFPDCLDCLSQALKFQ